MTQEKLYLRERGLTLYATGKYPSRDVAYQVAVEERKRELAKRDLANLNKEKPKSSESPISIANDFKFP